MLNALFRSLVIALLFAIPAAHAQERGTKEEAKKLVEAAIAHLKTVGQERALSDFTTDKAHWTRKDLYVYVLDTEANMLAHGANEKLIGKNHLGQKDRNGKEFNKETLAVAASPAGEGWVEYDWIHPQTKKFETKSSFVKKAPGTKLIVGVGVYPQT